MEIQRKEEVLNLQNIKYFILTIQWIKYNYIPIIIYILMLFISLRLIECINLINNYFYSRINL